MTRSRFSIIVILLLTTLFYLQYRIWFQPGGIRDYMHLKKRVEEAKLDNLKLKKMNEELLFQIKRLQNNQDDTEEHARNDLGMIKKDEVFYHVVR